MPVRARDVGGVERDLMFDRLAPEPRMAFPDITLEQFRADMLAAGYDEVLERRWALGTVLDMREHALEADALVVQGWMRLAVDGEPARDLLRGSQGLIGSASCGAALHRRRQCICIATAMQMHYSMGPAS